MPDLISLPCEILFCVVFNRACPVLDTGASRGLAGFVYDHYLTGFPGPALDPDPGFAGMTGAYCHAGLDPASRGLAGFAYDHYLTGFRGRP